MKEGVMCREGLQTPKGYPGKRALDVVASVTVLCLLSPVLAVVWLLVRTSLGRPVLFRQVRPGFAGKPFAIIKLRTMSDARDEAGNLLPDAQRLTSLGSFLRRTSLDEVPELINVVRGEMSLVGPRPLLMQYMPYFTPRERMRFVVRPGITGLAQVSGRNLVGWDRRLELDAQYAERVSLLLDLRILVQTLMVVLSRQGVSADVDQVETWLDRERAGSGDLDRT